MATQKFTGVIPPVVVPDTEDHQLDVASFERSINRMIDAGVDGLFFLGSSGEVVFSTDERRRQIVAEAVRIVDHRVPVLVGIIDTETERMIEHGKVAQELGADALVATCPFYALQGMTEVEEHFRILHEELDLPIFAYDIPVCVHTKLPWKLLAKLGAEGVLAGVKDSSGDDISFRYLIQENEKNGHPMSILTGHEVVVDGAYLGGADGSVPGLANVEPEGYVRQWKAAQLVTGLPSRPSRIASMRFRTSGCHLGRPGLCRWRRRLQDRYEPHGHLRQPDHAAPGEGHDR